SPCSLLIFLLPSLFPASGDDLGGGRPDEVSLRVAHLRGELHDGRNSNSIGTWQGSAGGAATRGCAERMHAVASRVPCRPAPPY
ncbi:unnamed protein product, partial [Urochloa humidicola]